MICKYPVLFTGMVETISGMEENYRFVRTTNGSLDVESFDHGKQLGYNVCKFRLINDKDLISNEVNTLFFQ
jgi:hypothetical protein